MLFPTEGKEESFREGRQKARSVEVVKGGLSCI